MSTTPPYPPQPEDPASGSEQYQQPQQPPQQPPQPPAYEGYPGGQPSQPAPQQSYYSGTPPQQAPQQSSSSLDGGAFFSGLFDFSFKNFITLSFSKIIYVLAIILITLGYLMMVVSGFLASTAVGIVILLLGWIPALIYLVFIRVGLEFAVAMIRTAQNTTVLAQRE